MGNLLAGQNLRQLLCATGRVFGRDDAQADAMNISEYGAHHRNGLRLIVFDANQHFFRLKDVHQNADTVDDLGRAILHQAVVGGDIRLTLGGVDDKRVDFIAAAFQLAAGREASAAQACNAKIMNALNKLVTASLLPVTPAVAVDPAVFTVGLDNNAHLCESRRMRRGVGSNRDHDTGGWRMDGKHSAPATG